MKTHTIFYLTILFICIIWNVCFPYIPTFASCKIKLALFVDKGAHARELLCSNLANDKSLSVTYITGEDVCNDCLKNFDVLFVPGGSGKREALSLTPEGQKKVRLFVRDGGIYLGVCAGCYLASCAHPEYLGLFPMTTVDKTHWRRGKATLPIEFTNIGMEIFGVKQSRVDVIYHNGPVLRAYPQYADKISILAYYRNEVVAPGGKTGVMVNAPAIVLARYGNGLVLGISPHPEATPGLTNIELNALHWLYDHRPQQEYSLPTMNESEINTAQLTQISTKKDLLHKSLSPQIYNEAERIFENTISSHYRHIHDGAAQQVQETNGKYKVVTDCSGFVSYVIYSISPEHYDTIYQLSGRTYPHAKTYAHFINNLPTKEIISGWSKINDFRELKRGDIIAWEKPANSNKDSKASGHVMIVVDPAKNPVYDIFNGKQIKYVEICVLDSSSVEHFPPQLLPLVSNSQFRDGIGKGMIRLILNERNDVIGFWEGSFSHEKNKEIKGPTYTNYVEFARLMSLF